MCKQFCVQDNNSCYTFSFIDKVFKLFKLAVYLSSNAFKIVRNTLAREHVDFSPGSATTYFLPEIGMN